MTIFVLLQSSFAEKYLFSKFNLRSVQQRRPKLRAEARMKPTAGFHYII